MRRRSTELPWCPCERVVAGAESAGFAVWRLAELARRTVWLAARTELAGADLAERMRWWSAEMPWCACERLVTGAESAGFAVWWLAEVAGRTRGLAAGTWLARCGVRWLGTRTELTGPELARAAVRGRTAWTELARCPLGLGAGAERGRSAQGRPGTELTRCTRWLIAARAAGRGDQWPALLAGRWLIVGRAGEAVERDCGRRAVWRWKFGLRGVSGGSARQCVEPTEAGWRVRLPEVGILRTPVTWLFTESGRRWYQRMAGCRNAGTCGRLAESGAAGACGWPAGAGDAGRGTEARAAGTGGRPTETRCPTRLPESRWRSARSTESRWGRARPRVTRLGSLRPVRRPLVAGRRATRVGPGCAASRFAGIRGSRLVGAVWWWKIAGATHSSLPDSEPCA